MKTKIPSLSYNAMFKTVIAGNKVILAKLVKAILDYYKIDIDITNKELIIKKNELDIDNYKDRQLICDYIIKIDEFREINIEINRSKYIGLSERNLTYSFKIYYDHFKSGDDYQEFNKYTLLQINFNNYKNPNGKSINRYYMIDADDLKNKLTNNYSIMNIDIETCYNLVYNKSNLEEISDLEVFGAVVACNYLEDIASILERRSLSMDKLEKEKLLSDIKDASQDKDTLKAVRLENSIEDRFRWVEEATRRDTREEVTKEVTKEVTEEVTNKLIKGMLKEKIPYQQISNITGLSVDEIIMIDKNL